MSIDEIKIRVKALELLKDKYKTQIGNYKWRLAEDSLCYWENQLDCLLMEEDRKEFSDDLSKLEIQLKGE